MDQRHPPPLSQNGVDTVCHGTATQQRLGSAQPLQHGSWPCTAMAALTLQVTALYGTKATKKRCQSSPPNSRNMCCSRSTSNTAPAPLPQQSRVCLPLLAPTSPLQQPDCRCWPPRRHHRSPIAAAGPHAAAAAVELPPLARCHRTQPRSQSISYRRSPYSRCCSRTAVVGRCPANAAPWLPKQAPTQTPFIIL